MAEHQIEQPFFQVVSCDVHDDNTTVLNLRAHGRWVYAEAKPDRIRNDVLYAKYLDLAVAARRQQDGTHEQEIAASAGQENGSRKTEKKDAASNGQDSGYSSDKSSDGQSNPSPNPPNHDAEQALRQFLVDSLDWTLDEAAMHGTPPRQRSLADWYNTTILLYDLEAGPDDKDLLRPVPRDDLDGQKYIRQTLTPHISLPKYLRNMSGVPWYSPDDLTVLEEEHNIHLSIHPTVVGLPSGSPSSTSTSSSSTERHESNEPTNNLQTAFLKLATPIEEPAIKREIKFLHNLSKLNLYNKGVRAPRLLGIVGTPAAPGTRPTKPSHASMLGFLITHIPQPVSLIEYMTTSIPQHRRSALSASVSSMVSILHQHGLVWGDAKADNFVISHNGAGELWMIDFGGSYTPGWIERGLEGTREGDEMGTRRIVNGLGDPENCVLGESEDDEDGEQELVEQGEQGGGEIGGVRGGVCAGVKRARTEYDEVDDAEEVKAAQEQMHEDEQQKGKRRKT